MKKDIQQLIKDIENEVRYTRGFIGKSKLDDRVMKAMTEVPREQFVPENLQPYAFDNGPLPIGHEQTISQPYIVALMSDLLATKPEHKVLEIGTGSGYQTAVLSQLCAKVYTVELIHELSKQAQIRFQKLKYKNIETHVDNGYLGWSEHAPYDGIIVTAAATHIPEALVNQLKTGGNMVIPIGMPSFHQELMLIEKNKEGELTSKKILGVAFVPLINNKKMDYNHLRI